MGWFGFVVVVVVVGLFGSSRSVSVPVLFHVHRPS